MNKDAMYERSPEWLQKLLVFVYGFKVRLERYGKEHDRYLEWLESIGDDAEAVKKLENELLASTLRYAKRCVPYYRSISNNRCLDSIDDFPVVTKDLLRENLNTMVASGYQIKKLIHLKTSGTTGTPTEVFADPDSRRRHYAFFSEIRRKHGLGLFPRRVTFLGRTVVSSAQTNPPFWRLDYAQNNLICSSYHLSDENLGEYTRKIEKYDPEEIFGYPSSLLRLAEYVRREGPFSIYPRLVIATGESLSFEGKRCLEDVFKSQVVNQYGCTEMGFFATECKNGNMHFRTEHGIVETLDEDRQPIFGSPGSLVVTNFVNKAMPLIRYEIGDRVTLAPPKERCSCGSPYPFATEIVGRTDDFIYKIDGTPVYRLSPVCKGISGLCATQIIQNRDLSLTLRLEVNDEFDKRSANRLERQLRAKIGEDHPLKMETFSHLPKDSTGKLKFVINNARG